MRVKVENKKKQKGCLPDPPHGRTAASNIEHDKYTSLSKIFNRFKKIWNEKLLIRIFLEDIHTY